MPLQPRETPQAGLERSHRLSILSLPSSVRHQIYKEADIIKDRFIDFACRTPNGYWWSSRIGFKDTYSLLQTNRIIYREVLAYIYSNNCFAIKYRPQESLRVLRNLSPLALASLRHLSINLNVAFPKPFAACDLITPNQPTVYHDYTYGQDHEELLDLSTEVGRTILEEWTLIAAYTFSHIHPSTLNFALICDVSTLETAQLVLAPLLTAPVFASCGIHLNRNKDHALDTLARNVAIAATTSSNTPFPFLLLPRELRKYIFSFTDLISPHKQVHYSVTGAYHLHYGSWYCCVARDGGIYPHRTCPSRNCWQHSFNGSQTFCSECHAAFWTECYCWKPPTPLFLVSRAIADLAREVFFGGNKFIMALEGRKEPWTVVDRLPEQIPSEKFFREVVPKDALKYIKTLELVFPPFQKPSLRPFKEWEDTLEAVRGDLNLPNLTIRVFFLDGGPQSRRQNESLALMMTNKKAKLIYNTYMYIVQPFRQLEGLRRLFVKAAWPWEWTEQGNRRLEEEKERVEMEMEDAEEMLERLVMGEEYESGSMGKTEMEEGPNVSLWKMEYDHEFYDWSDHYIPV